MLILQGIRYIHPNRDQLFEDLNLTINKNNKIALVGNNGTGKSKLLRIIAGALQPSAGTIKAETQPYYIPQHYGQYNACTIAQALGIDDKLKALHDILDGNVNEANLNVLNDDWTIEERCREALAHWKLTGIELYQSMATLSGGQKTKVFLAGIMIHSPDLVLMDEPSNHLDTEGRNILYEYIKSTTDTLLVVSHDRTLLNLLHTVYELDKRGITVYGGNYEFYKEQKRVEEEALHRELQNKEKTLRKAKEVERETLERQQKLDARGKKKQEKAGLPTISMNTLRNNAEKSTARTKDVHAGKVSGAVHDLQQIRNELPGADKMKIGFDNSALHKGKVLLTLRDVNHTYTDIPLWKQPFNIQVTSGERIAIQGANGSGKTTLIKILLGTLQSTNGSIERPNIKSVYIDQDYSLINNMLTVYEQAQQFNTGVLQEHEIKIRLSRLLFTKEYWDKPCYALSGGEKMRLMLCCLTIDTQAPDMIVLDEPTNNLDIQNIEILTNAINEYSGTLIVVSHDSYFLEQVNTQRVIAINC